MSNTKSTTAAPESASPAPIDPRFAFLAEQTDELAIVPERLLVNAKYKSGSLWQVAVNGDATIKSAESLSDVKHAHRGVVLVALGIDGNDVDSVLLEPRMHGDAVDLISEAIAALEIARKAIEQSRRPMDLGVA